MKLAIIGSRSCGRVELEDYIKTLPDMIISGGARGVDTSAREFAIRHNIPIVEFVPQYHLYGRCAPLVRNRQIVDECDMLYAFWDGSSHGTKYTVRYARKINKPVQLFYATEDEHIYFHDEER